jgi:hypothetical protein
MADGGIPLLFVDKSLSCAAALAPLLPLSTLGLLPDFRSLYLQPTG